MRTSGHIGSALSIADILAALYGGVLRAARRPGRAGPPRPVQGPRRACPLCGARIDRALPAGTSRHLLHRRHAAGRASRARPRRGRLLHGLAGSWTVARGRARRWRRAWRHRHAACSSCMSDAELNEGSVWEAVMFAAHHRLANLVVIARPQRAAGDRLHPRRARPRRAGAALEAFGWDVHELDGHDPAAMQATIEASTCDRGRAARHASPTRRSARASASCRT